MVSQFPNIRDGAPRGRYGPVCYGEGHYGDTEDLLIDPDGVKHVSSQATI